MESESLTRHIQYSKTLYKGSCGRSSKNTDVAQTIIDIRNGRNTQKENVPFTAFFVTSRKCDFQFYHTTLVSRPWVLPLSRIFFLYHAYWEKLEARLVSTQDAAAIHSAVRPALSAYLSETSLLHFFDKSI